MLMPKVDESELEDGVRSSEGLRVLLSARNSLGLLKVVGYQARTCTAFLLDQYQPTVKDCEARVLLEPREPLEGTGSSLFIQDLDVVDPVGVTRSFLAGRGIGSGGVAVDAWHGHGNGTIAMAAILVLAEDGGYDEVTGLLSRSACRDDGYLRDLRKFYGRFGFGVGDGSVTLPRDRYGAAASRARELIGRFGERAAG